ncbi:MAG: class I SAM-dependent DNA methyltransferase [Acidimicrobiales bacterium]
MERDELRRLAHGWDGLADEYAERLGDELDHKPDDRRLLARFAELADPTAGPVLDVGCGPGHVAAHLHQLGVTVRGVDLSPSMVTVARRLHPQIDFEVGDMLEPVSTGPIAGAICFYSLIHLARDDVPVALGHLADAMAAGGPLLLAAHAGTGTLVADEVFDQPIPMAITLYEADELAEAASKSGFEVDEALRRQPYPEEGPTHRVYVLARSSVGRSGS